MSQTFQTFVGVDLHKCTVSLAAVDLAGVDVAKLKISTKSTCKIEDWLLKLPRPTHMAVEACPFVEWFIDRFAPCVDRIDIADATELANRRGKRRKTDRNDSLDVARRLARGECPLGYIAGHGLMQLRKLGRHWRLLSRLLSRTKHSMKSMLNAANIRGPKFDGASAQRWFWAGLTADMKESAGRTQSGNITKAGSVTLRWALCKAAITLCQSDARQEAIRQRLIKHIGKPKANVAMGRRRPTASVTATWLHSAQQALLLLRRRPRLRRAGLLVTATV